MSTLIQLSTKQNPIVLTTDGTPVAGTIVETDCAIIQVNQGQLDNRDMFSVIAKQLIVNGIVGQSLYRLQEAR
jgi:phage terminase large subunit-like protein